ncbi:helix-turn-helix domain-containing protein [uncultured Candidatus Kuenenia sp.]|uniref:helix-turn-helix domain-containing protein n=1 Tax=uncultured Candidatus Kuenenia sp. TaxID=1048336 RepID=UPI0025E66F0C|nr:helix-turn-helix domain-containing protein [uncultured Candidatus Kuenenia sp.]
MSRSILLGVFDHFITPCYKFFMRKNIVGSNVRMIRERLGITQEELALRSGLTQGYINFLEHGKRGYSERSLEKIVNALGIQISRLFEEKTKEEPAIVAEQAIPYGKRRRIYDTIISLLEKLPAPVIDHYKILLEAEVEIRNGGSVDRQEKS